MNYLPVNGLLNFGVNLGIASKETSVRKRVKSLSPKQGDAAESQSPEMVPKIAVAPHDLDDLTDDRKEGKHLSETWTEDEDFTEDLDINRDKPNWKGEDARNSVTDSTTISHMSLNSLDGDVLPDNCDQLAPLLLEQRHDEFETEIAGKGDVSSDEGSFTIGLQVFFPFLVAGFGTVSAGILLDVVQVSYEVFSC